MKPVKAVEKLRAQFGEAIGPMTEFRGETTVRVAREQILEVCRYLRDECGFNMLTDVAGVDNYGEDPRYEVVYHLYSMADKQMLRLKVGVPEDDLVVDSVVSVWRTADWHEREAYDMFGIRFRGHPNLKRILMWEGYPYHPLRKDFPLAGLPAELPETAVEAGRVEAAPMLGGPFVPAIGTRSSVLREPRQVDTVVENIERVKNPTKKELV
ncbi:MAG: NADH-quinone oxidoreductase subunit C [Verrucomicrobiae bacterium]|nr:NADH-quinone oxidoreductase subunit C [Verrucomicrobiae bacterium]MDW8344059.1 NADH-quinone oxidoreductase subunit C [Verrucomicrobiae bacterium]